MNVTVTLGMTTWNQGVGTLALTTSALLRESDRLAKVGVDAIVLIVDNKSTDGTAECLSKLKGCVTVQVPQSVGSGVLRNHIITESFLEGSDYVAFLDGDIAVIPYSIVTMVRHLEQNRDLYAVGMDPVAQTMDWGSSSTYCGSALHHRRDALMYLCGYGVFRQSVFDTIRFDESGPFGEVGWGSEDDDLFLQMVEAEMPADYLEGYTFYHGTPRSSWPSLRALGIDPLQSFETRREYLLQKWRALRPQHVHSGHLNLLKGQQLHA